MTTTTTQIDWAALRAPFPPEDVDFRVQGRANEQTGRAQVVAYIDARAVQDRLDEVVGAGNWSFDWQALVIDQSEVQVAKGTLTICGVSKADAGTASNFEQTLGAVSHCFKRAAVHWGIGRYLYNLSTTWVTVEKGGRIPDQVLRELRAKLPRPHGTPMPAPSATPMTDTRAAETASTPDPPEEDANAGQRHEQAIAPGHIQLNAARDLREHFPGVGQVELATWLEDLLERPLDVVKLKRGLSDLTLAESKKIAQELGRLTDEALAQQKALAATAPAS